MVKSKVGLKRVKKSTKRGLRSYWVSSSPKKLKRGSVLASFNHPGPNSGSDHSWLALAIGKLKQETMANSEHMHSPDFGSREAALGRRAAAKSASRTVAGEGGEAIAEAHGFGFWSGFNDRRSHSRRDELSAAFGTDPSNVVHKPRRGSFE